MNSTLHPAPVDEPISIRELLSVVFLRKWLIFGVFSVTLAITCFLVFYFLTPLYEAAATITLHPSNFVNALSEGVPQSDFERTVTFQTQKDVIKSGMIAGRVAERLKLGDRRVLSNLERLRLWLRAQKRELGHTLNIERWKKPEDMRALAVEAIYDKLEIVTKPESSAMKITYRARDPKEAAETLNAVLDEFHNYYYNQIRERAQGTLNYLDSRIVDAQQKLAASEAALVQFRRQDTLDLSRNSNANSQPASRVGGSKVARAEGEKAAGKGASAGSARTAAAESAARPTGAHSIVGLTDSVQVQNEIKLYVLSMEEELRKLLSEYTENHPSVVELKQKIARYVETMNTMPDRELQLFRLKRDLEANQDTYLQLRKTYTRAKVIADGSTDKINLISVVDYAEPNDDPVSPKPRIALVLALVFGLALGIVAAFVLEYLDHRVKTPRDIERHLKLRVLGSLQEV